VVKRQKKFLVLLFFLFIIGFWFYLAKNRDILNSIYREKEIRVLVKGENDKIQLLKVPQGSKLKDIYPNVDIEIHSNELLNLERELSDGDIIDFTKGL